LGSRTPDALTSAEADRLRPLASAAGIALENARLYEQALSDARTKSMLLDEVNHRVKNNLAGIIGMLYTTQRYARQNQNPFDVESLIQDLTTRIDGLATVHNMLSAAQWGPISLKDLCEAIMGRILQGLPADKFVSTHIQATELVRISPNQANSMAMVINELTTNTIKYGLTDMDTLRIDVAIENNGDLVHFEFRNNGPDYPPDVLVLERTGAGLYLIQSIVTKGLRGQLDLHNDHGPVTSIFFPLENGIMTTQPKE
jgi:two-component sensor histidine kinase